MAKAAKKNDQAVRTILQALQAEYGPSHPKANIEAYRYNPASIRIRITDPDFRRTNLLDREELVDPILEKLPEDIRSEITLLLLLTPEEQRESMGSMEFDNPTPSLL
jgi:YD repeat-containing protein